MSASSSPASGPRITVVMLVYHGARFVPGLLAALRAQKHAAHVSQAEWMEAIVMDNGSTDDTGRVLAEEYAKAGSPAHVRVVTNPRNLGYAGAMNEAFGLVRTPYVLTCHCDCLFGSESYVGGMLDLMEATPDAAAITGQPAIPDDAKIPFVEKVNLVEYLQDIFPDASGRDLVPVGFAEGRCDTFRLAAVRAAGFYDTTHYSAGEDQILSARMRREGFEIYQAPKLRYLLSVSDEQDSVGKLVRHMTLFGEKHPILVLRSGATRGAMSGVAGRNRRARSMLRLSQLVFVAVLVLGIVLIALRAPLASEIAAGALVAMLLWKTWIFRAHLAAVRFRLHELAAFYVLQPVFDVAYALGFARGLWKALTQGQTRLRAGGGSSPAA